MLQLSHMRTVNANTWRGTGYSSLAGRICSVGAGVIQLHRSSIELQLDACDQIVQLLQICGADNRRA